MIVFALDDEPLLLRRLCRGISEEMPDAELHGFDRGSAVLAAMEEGLLPDVAFLDIEMPGMSGIEMAECIIARAPDCSLVFCTSYPQYAVDAINLHASSHLGYLIKPVSPEAIRRELAFIETKRQPEKLLQVHCFGTFEVFSRGVRLSFRRSRTKELLAFLIDRKGAGVTARQICTTLWDDSSNDKRNINYLYQLFDDLRHALNQVGAGELLQRNGYNYSLDTGKIDCDYYSFLSCGEPEFYGEYMTQYSWAEETCALLWNA
ncbi:MAG: response regulator [Bacillota bacterium]|nr:response regulator [Bacillota bacterium]